jgi:hypothetical protein
MESDLNTLPGSGFPLRTTAIIVYLTLVVLALAMPQAAVNRLNDFTPNPVRDAALAVAQPIADMSHRLGLDRPYREGRRLFLWITGKTED